MVTAGVRWAQRALAVVGFAALLSSAPARADDEKKNPLREELLKLNSITGETAQKEKLRALAKDKEKTKKLVQEAAKMVKEAKGKEHPFNYNGRADHRAVGPVHPAVRRGRAVLRAPRRGRDQAQERREDRDRLQRPDGRVLRQQEVRAGVGDVREGAGPERSRRRSWSGRCCSTERLVARQGQGGEVRRRPEDRRRPHQGRAERRGGTSSRPRARSCASRASSPAAIEAYTTSLEKIDANKAVKQADRRTEFKDDTRYILTSLYIENKEVDKAAKQLQTLIKRHPDNATYKNDLGFIWCDNDLNLEESEKLIREAIDLDTKVQEKDKKDGKIDKVVPNAAYLDSLGWVLFKQKKYKEALEPLKQASADADDGSHLEIWDHLADCYMALGQKKEAIATWEKGLKYRGPLQARHRAPPQGEREAQEGPRRSKESRDRRTRSVSDGVEFGAT